MIIDKVGSAHEVTARIDLMEHDAPGSENLQKSLDNPRQKSWQQKFVQLRQFSAHPRFHCLSFKGVAHTCHRLMTGYHCWVEAAEGMHEFSLQRYFYSSPSPSTLNHAKHKRVLAGREAMRPYA